MFCDGTSIYFVAPFLIWYQLLEVARGRQIKGDESETSKSVSKPVLIIELAYFSYDSTCKWFLE